MIWLALATMVFLALTLSAIVLAAPSFAIAATLDAVTIGACFAYQPWAAAGASNQPRSFRIDGDERVVKAHRGEFRA
jgi:hypothetical protein